MQYSYKISVKGTMTQDFQHFFNIKKTPPGRFLNFTIEYLRKNKKVRETVFACSYGAKVESFKQKIVVKNLVTLSCKGLVMDALRKMYCRPRSV